jgi:hypothetical protein
MAAVLSPSARVTVARRSRSAAACSSIAFCMVCDGIDVLNLDGLQRDAPVGDVVGDGRLQPGLDLVTR